MVPTFTCGLLRSNFSLDTAGSSKDANSLTLQNTASGGIAGAHDRNRTGDLVLTKDVLYRLSYVSDEDQKPDEKRILKRPAKAAAAAMAPGAGSGNRTRVISLEG